MKDFWGGRFSGPKGGENRRKVSVEVTEVELEGDYTDVPGLQVTCGRCGHYVEVYGTGDNSFARGCIMLRDECPKGEDNFYSREEE